MSPKPRVATEEQQYRSVVVTGAAGGIGRIVTAAFRNRGDSVVGVDIAEPVDVIADVSTVEGTQRAVAAAVAAHDSLDVLILAAGVQYLAPIAEFPLEEFERVVSVHLTGPFLMLKAAWPWLTKRPGGRIIALGSVSSLVGEPFKAAYVAAKHGLAGLIKVAAIEGADHGLTANIIAPGWVRTSMVEDQVEAHMRLRDLSRETVLSDVMLGRQPMKRFVEPTEVANLALYLSSPESQAITGACFAIDGGWTAT